LLGFDPQQVSAVLQGGDAVQNNAVFTSTFAELEQTGGQALGLEQLAVGLDDHVAVLDVVSAGDVVTVQEAVVLVTQVAGFVGYGDLLGQTGTQGVGTRSEEHTSELQSRE